MTHCADIERLSNEEREKAIRKLHYGGRCPWAIGEEIVQEVELEIFDRLQRDPYRVKVTAFWCRLERRRIDMERRAARERSALREVAQTVVRDDDDPASIVAMHDEVRYYLNMVDGRVRDDFALYLAGDSVEEIARRTNRTQDAVRMSLMRARKRFREARKEAQDKLSGLVIGLVYAPRLRHPQLLSLAGVTSAGLLCFWASAASAAPSPAPPHVVVSSAAPPAAGAPSVRAPLRPSEVTVISSPRGTARWRDGGPSTLPRRPLNTSPLFSTGPLGDKRLASTGAQVDRKPDGKSFLQEVTDCVLSGVDVSTSSVHCNS